MSQLSDTSDNSTVVAAGESNKRPLDLDDLSDKSGTEAITMENSPEANTSAKRPQFGNRTLNNPADVYSHNAWDNVQWDPQQETEALEKISHQERGKMSWEDGEKVCLESAGAWDRFYGKHENKFFKDRHWLFTEMPELFDGMGIVGGKLETVREDQYVLPDKLDKIIDNDPPLCGEAADLASGVANLHVAAGQNNHKLVVGDTEHSSRLSEAPNTWDSDEKRVNILEVGCGVGNTAFPILQSIPKFSDSNDNSTKPKTSSLYIYCCDYSSEAVSLVKANEAYDESKIFAFQWDITRPLAEISDDRHPPSNSVQRSIIEPGSIDFILLIFCFSAIEPGKQSYAISNLSALLRPGGRIFFRDYGRFDMAQLRFKPGRMISDHFYARGDGTCCYFFTEQELKKLFCEQGGLEQESIYVDRRLQVNRGKGLKMYRIWIQCKFKKPLGEPG